MFAEPSAAQEKEGLGAPHCSGKYSFLCIPQSFLSGQNWCLKCAKPLTVTIIVWWVSWRANSNNIPLCLWNSLWTNKLITTVWIPHFLPPEIKSVLCQAVVYSKIWHLQTWAWCLQDTWNGRLWNADAHVGWRQLNKYTGIFHSCTSHTLPNI